MTQHDWEDSYDLNDPFLLSLLEAWGLELPDAEEMEAWKQEPDPNVSAMEKINGHWVVTAKSLRPIENIVQESRETRMVEVMTGMRFPFFFRIKADRADPYEAA